jgi:hypothetical protein
MSNFVDRKMILLIEEIKILTMGNLGSGMSL